MSSGAATLWLVIILGGFLGLLALTLWDHRRTVHSMQMRKGNKRIRREIHQLMERESGHDD